MNEEINEEKLIRLKLLSKRLDNNFTIPGTKAKIGLDPIMGAIPIIGDLIGALLSTYIMYSGIKMGVPRSVIAQMATNIALDFTIGWIPIIGDIFDIIWKSNKSSYAMKLLMISIVSCITFKISSIIIIFPILIDLTFYSLLPKDFLLIYLSHCYQKYLLLKNH